MFFSFFREVRDKYVNFFFMIFIFSTSHVNR
nr:MAG TPA: hypothetical protein [Bacteriophage sp.]